MRPWADILNQLTAEDQDNIEEPPYCPINSPESQTIATTYTQFLNTVHV